MNHVKHFRPHSRRRAADSCLIVQDRVNIVTWHGFGQLQTGAYGSCVGAGRGRRVQQGEAGFELKMLDQNYIEHFIKGT